MFRQERRGLARAIVVLAWPTVIEQVMQVAVQYIDTAMVGVLGTQATAAVGATTTVGWLLYSTILAFGVGFLALVSQTCGAGDDAGTRNAVSQAILVVLVVGVISTVVPLALSPWVPVWMQVDPAIRDMTWQYFFILYLPMLPRTASAIFGTVLRAAGDTRTPMKVAVIVNAINVVLNFLLIYPTRTVTVLGLSFVMPGAGWGVAGAAAASAIAFTWGGIHITMVLLRHPRLSPGTLRLRPDWAVLRRCWTVTFPNMLQHFGTALGFVFFAAMINSLGDVATATHTIANIVESAFYIPGSGMQTAAATLVGNAWGARDEKRLRSLAAVFIPMEMILMAVTGALLFVSAPALMALFSQSDEVIALGSTVLRMVAVSEPLFGFYIIVEGMMMGLGKTRLPFLYNICGMWGVRIVGTWICTQFLHLGLVAAWGCMIGHNMLVFVLYLITYLRDRWHDPMPEAASRT